MTIEELLNGVESQCVEFKKSLSLRREGLEALDGMLNAEPARGVVIFGISPDRQVVGVEEGDLDKAQRSLAQHIREKFDPPIQAVIDLPEIDGKKLLVVSAARHRGVPYHEYDGRTFTREGSSCRQLSLAEKQHLQRARNRDLHLGPWRCDKCGARVSLFVGTEISGQGMSRSYKCRINGCDGEFWPA